MQECTNTSMQVCKFACLKVYKHVSMQVCNCASNYEWIYASMQVHMYACIQLCKY